MTPEPQPTIPNPSNWRKASYSADQTDCVEVAEWPTSAAIRDTKHRELGALFFSGSEWDAFLRSTKY